MLFSNPISRVLHGESVEPAPVWLMRQAGRYLPEYRQIRSRVKSFQALCMQPSLAAEVTLQPLHRFELDGAIIFSDILLIPMAMQRKISFPITGGAFVEPFETIDEISELIDRYDENLLQPVYDAIARTRQDLRSECALIGFAGAPWTLACYMIDGGSKAGFPRSLQWLQTDRAALNHLCDQLQEAVFRHTVRQIKAGAEIIQLFDSWAGLLPENEQREWSIRRLIELAGRIRSAMPDSAVILYPRGVSKQNLSDMILPPCVSISIDENKDMAEMRSCLGKKAVLQGNLHPKTLLAGGKQLVDEVRHIISSQIGFPHIFNLGHGVIKETPPDHVAALIEEIRNGKID